jgi:hypothetical protein
MSSQPKLSAAMDSTPAITLDQENLEGFAVNGRISGGGLCRSPGVSCKSWRGISLLRVIVCAKEADQHSTSRCVLVSPYLVSQGGYCRTSLAWRLIIPAVCLQLVLKWTRRIPTGPVRPRMAVYPGNCSPVGACRIGSRVDIDPLQDAKS